MEHPIRPNPTPEPGTEPAAGPPPPVDGPDGHETAQVSRQVRIEAPVAAVWRSLTDPDELGRWLQADVVLDGAVVPGAAGQVIDGDGGVHHLLITEVDPARRVAWHWWEEGGELSSVEITARPDGDATVVRVVETVALAKATSGGRRAGVDAVDRFDRRWNEALPHLAARFAAQVLSAPAAPVA